MKINDALKLETFLDKCKKAHLKITPQRIFIYKIVAQSRQHPDTTEVYETVRKEFPNISFDTVHRTLLTFSDCNLINTVEGFGNTKRFDPNMNNHHHLHCEKCGKIIDFTHEAYDRLHAPVGLTCNFKVTKKRVIICGICKDCQRNIKKT
ncbi:MAG: hypothetical protein A2Y62_15745 [Candidatus Fischerbacteria bacterium RBG_13_37_8]|uniref:Transcriptional repressor n=1 Tax=Candidatus Fischerbacteria bacterium RBG_13_37_8 TaxID=1817863 RepID=A0A1F5VWB4_9BACT|nr:MAG: hypothetical protein A2Y62_15745 [Candidatus Fischerbacteria bacterium RBG_13_37_8]